MVLGYNKLQIMTRFRGFDTEERIWTSTGIGPSHIVKREIGGKFIDWSGKHRDMLNYIKGLMLGIVK